MVRWGTKGIASLLAVCAGWIVAFTLFVILWLAKAPVSWFEAYGLIWLVATAAVSLAGWLLCGLPFVLIVSPASRAFVMPWSLMAGMLLGSLTFWIGLGWMAVRSGGAEPVALMWSFAVVVAATALVAYRPLLGRLCKQN